MGIAAFGVSVGLLGCLLLGGCENPDLGGLFGTSQVNKNSAVVVLNLYRSSTQRTAK